MIQTYLDKIKSAIYGKDVRQAIHDGIKQCYEDGKAGQLDLIAREGVEEVKSNISNPNLLINGDFRNPINQRGQANYTSANSWDETYTIDRWCMMSGLNLMSLSVNENSITVTTGDALGHFRQLFETILPNGNYTVTINVLSLSGSVSFHTDNGTKFAIEEGKNVFVITDTLTYVNILMETNSSIEIQYIKLESGSIATPFVPRLYAEEMLLCQRFYKEVLVTGLPVNYYTSDYAYVEASILLEQNMRAFCKAYFKSTDITIGFRCANDTTPSGSVDKENIIATNQRIILKGTCTKMPISVWTKDSDILCLDAEIY